MISQISLSGEIFDALYKAKENEDREFESAENWLTDIIENADREKRESCEICDSCKQLEVHHVRGRKFGNEVITACGQCHKTLTNNQKLRDKSWLDSNSENKNSFLKLGFIDICNLKFDKTGIEIYKRFAEKLTEGFSYD